MIDQIRDFLAAGPDRRKAMEAAINSGLHKYLGPTGIPQRVGVASEVFSPVIGLEQGGAAARQMMDPRLSLYDRIGAGGRMASEIAGVVAPAGAARLTGIGGDDAARALEEALTGFSARPGAVAAKGFAGDEAGAIRAWHGSPHDFDKFSMDKIGTGEGAQAYGHGLYFADNPDVATAYRDTLTNFNPTHIERVLVERGVSPDAANTYARWASDTGGRKLSFDNFAEMVNTPGPAPAIESFRAKIRDELPKIRAAAEGTQGRLYEVEIDANPEDFLDWDAPLSEQPQKVRDALKQIDASAGGMSLKDRVETIEAAKADLPRLQYLLDDKTLNIDGNGVEALARWAGDGAPSKEVAQAALRDKIPGIRYLDQGSRGAGDGTRNYVVFDDNLISIIKKYGIAGAAGMLGMSASELQAQINQQQPAPLDGLPR